MLPLRASHLPHSEGTDERIRDKALALGFDAVGFARADEPLEVDFRRYRAFVDEGMHGEMRYLAEAPEARRRLDGDEILPGARSVVCVAQRYQRPAREEARDPETARLVARYARGRDYHNFLRRKLRQLAAFVRSLGTPEHPVQARALCDTAPVLERAWAQRAGLGFIGKNGLLLHPGIGSMVLLGEVVTTLELTPGVPMAERCGSCTRCLDACPTHAFVQPFVLDPRRCVSYLTIEHRSAIDPELRAGVGEHLFGCDDCQAVCPFNASERGRERTGGAFEPLGRWEAVRLEALLALDEEAWARLSEGTPVRRATAEGLARNAAIVLGNRGEPGALEPLRAAAAGHPSAMVREAAAWAVGRIEASPRV
jgi:epoxyqueuosine reductase